MTKKNPKRKRPHHPRSIAGRKGTTHAGVTATRTPMPSPQFRGTTWRPSVPAANKLRAAFAAEERNDLDEATRLYAEITMQYPEFAAGWHYYGLLLHRQERSNDGLAALHRAHQIEPENPLFLSNIAQVLLETDDVEQALACISRAHELDPDHGQIFARYAQMMLEQGQARDMLPEVARHLDRHPDSWHLWLLAGKWRERAGDKAGAIIAFTTADRLAPAAEATPRLHLGALHRGYDEADLAEKNFLLARTKDPECARAFMGLANIAAQRGCFKEAKSLCRTALGTDSNLLSAWSFLSHISEPDEIQNLIPELEKAELSAVSNDHSHHHASIYFALGKSREDAGDYNRAFENYSKANAMVARFRPYYRAAEEISALDIQRQISETFVNRADSFGQVGSGAVFIIGMPRSGTTLVETIVGSHPAVAMGGEMRFLQDYLTQQTLKSADFDGMATWLHNASDTTLGKLARRWHEVLRTTAGEHALVTDKLPENFRNVGLILACLPDARIIYVHRDPRDNCVSCYATAFARGHNYSYSLQALGHYYQLHTKMIEHWETILSSDKILDLEYESLITEPETQIRRLIDYLDLPWDERCMTPDKTKRLVATASVHQVRQPIHSRSIGRWHRFESHLQPLLDALSEPLPNASIPDHEHLNFKEPPKNSS